jgi:prolycopene isomerase
MRFHAESKRDAYDAIVVGAGLGGLTAAAILARSGLGVLVVERHDRVGGYAHSFRRGSYLFDSAVHLVGGCEPVAFEGGGLLHRLLSSLGVQSRCRFQRIEPSYAAVYPDARVEAPSDLEEFVRVHTAACPAEAKGLRQVLQECLNVRQETRRAESLQSPLDLMKTPGRFPTLLRYRRATLGEVLDDHLDSPRLKAHVGSLWPYVGLPPSRVSFLYFASMLMSYLADGAYYCVGSFQRLAEALASAVETSGGEVLLRSSVRRIVVEDGRASGVVLENGQRIAAPVVVSNADLRQTVEELTGRECFPARYTARLGRMANSLSAFVVYLAARLELDPTRACHETFLYPDWSHDDAYRSSLAGEPSWLSVTIPTLTDASLAPSGEHLVTLTTLVAYDPPGRWRADKQRLAERLLDRAGLHLPGLREGLCFLEAGTPRTLERYTRASGGAAYGFELSPRQVGPGRPGIRTPVDGLWLAGHWTQPGGGVYGVVSSGIQVARSVLGFASERELWRALPAAPPSAPVHPTRRS